MKLEYLDWCINESMRLYPPVTGFTNRVATDEIDHDGVKIGAGLSLVFPTQVAHNHPRNFENPLCFIPERFKESLRHPLAYQPFGDGPRNCVGMRSALLAMKLAVCHIFRSYELRTDEQVEIVNKVLISQPREVVLRAEKLEA
ncbi:cytochrome P450 3A19-like [Galendromus occidentalis]|uniref:Cytochrome P450 3A19-like n=1 Tax=Galendromus occidentalis TaxID=34638 RepID=A0AAJ7L3U3_9ACAR|nr:cytochrome P450 3A19-like [Galendromus occidentalis]